MMLSDYTIAELVTSIHSKLSGIAKDTKDIRALLNELTRRAGP